MTVDHIMFERKETDLGWATEDRWDYTYLPEPYLSQRLRHDSRACHLQRTDIISFQPSQRVEHIIQDRCVVGEWPMPNGNWKFRGVFDGHGGHHAVNWVAKELPNLIQVNLSAQFSVYATSSGSLPSHLVSEVLRDSIRQFDKEVTNRVLSMFPSVEQLKSFSDEEIRAIVNDKCGGESGSSNFDAVARCLNGSTVLVALTDPEGKNLWIASLGDCQGVIGTKSASGEWETRLLSGYHNVSNEAEEKRIRAEHANEPGCIEDDRILGALAVSRAIGDCMFKLPGIYTERVFKNHDLGHNIAVQFESHMVHNLTPPYVSNVAEVQHIDLTSGHQEGAQRYLVLCTDGLIDRYEDLDYERDTMGKTWLEVLDKRIGSSYTQDEPNLALRLLRYGLGDAELERVSALVTVEADFRWIDDVTVLVVKL